MSDELSADQAAGTPNETAFFLFPLKLRVRRGVIVR